ncbi:hypothetical protein QAD02_000006 [Eretmocerus hayati]|uniref:Uncharacterized protein n=1 Tax=Eretmocerus hayati TaxID=131215 RepID=A0ACC2NC60_9HYME|nr:hypothetical protein QAD02_000006 [Eretmocerus hayati]
MDPGPAMGHGITKTPATTLTKWQMYNFIEVRETTKSNGKYNKGKIGSKTVAGQCGLCKVVMTGHGIRHMRSHRKICFEGNRTPLADVCVNQPQQPLLAQAVGRPESHGHQVFSTSQAMLPQIGSSPQPTSGCLLNSSQHQPILPQLISAQPSSALHQPRSQPISTPAKHFPSSSRSHPYPRPQANANSAHRRNRQRTARNVDDQNIKLLKFAVRHQIDFSELDCDVSRELFESLDANYAVPQTNDFKTKILDQAIIELRTLQSTFEYRPYIIVTSQGANNNKQVFSFAISKGGNYVYIDSIHMPRGVDAPATLEKFCDDSVELARQELNIKEVRFLMHEGVGRLKNVNRDENPTYMRFPSFRDLIMSFLTFDKATADKIGLSKLTEYSSVILSLLEKTKQASYTAANALQDIFDIREKHKDLLINPNLISYFAEDPNPVHVMANYLDIRYIKKSHFQHLSGFRDKSIAFILDNAPTAARPGFGHYVMGETGQFWSLLQRNQENPTKFWEEAAIFNADMSKFALHMLSIPAAAKKLPPHKVACILGNTEFEHNSDARNLYCSIMFDSV